MLALEAVGREAIQARPASFVRWFARLLDKNICRNDIVVELTATEITSSLMIWFVR
jgi:hypothetical protein